MTRPNTVRVLHFADAHIDIANFGRHDPETALPVRVVDFLKALDQIVDAAVEEAVDLVIFAGDAYRDRNPQPTFQREWGRRIMRLSEAGIPTLLLVGNHDVAPASGRAHTLHEYRTLAVPHVNVADRIHLWGPAELNLPVQIITVPWVARSQLMTREETIGKTVEAIIEAIEERVTLAVEALLDAADPALPLILTAHASVQGATYGSERTVMLGHELVLSRRLVTDNRLDYVALGHIHKHQCLTAAERHPPVVYAGSIERIDFGEVKESKGFVLAEVGRGQTTWQFKKLPTRRFIDLKLDTPDADTFMADILRQLPLPEEVDGAICRIQLSYPADWESLLDENAIAQRFADAFSFHLQKHRLADRRARLGETAAVEQLSPAALLEIFWTSSGVDEGDIEAMQELAREILGGVDGGETWS